MQVKAASSSLKLFRLWGTIIDVAPGVIRIAGISELAGVGNEIIIEKQGTTVLGEILTVSGDSVTALLFSPCDTLRIGDPVQIEQEARIEPGDHWLGQIVNYRGDIASGDSAPPMMRATPRRLLAAPLPAHARRGIGPRLASGWMVTDTVLPICRGQRLGLFAGSGVGKSTFLGSLAAGMDADRVVIALIGERSREVNEFVRNVLPESIMSKTVVVAATASEPPGAKKRAAYCAMAAAEHFRDQGLNVLFLFDSITRPGTDGKGDITAVYSVLVAGSDMEEPVADMIRGILDGHIILARDIAERGRYPAIDILRSVSRSLPHAATDDENALIRECRRMFALYEEIAPMLRANLYEFGKDAEADRAIALYSLLDRYAGTPNDLGIKAAFDRLREILRTERSLAAQALPATPIDP